MARRLFVLSKVIDEAVVYAMGHVVQVLHADNRSYRRASANC